MLSLNMVRDLVALPVWGKVLAVKMLTAERVVVALAIRMIEEKKSLHR